MNGMAHSCSLRHAVVLITAFIECDHSFFPSTGFELGKGIADTLN